MNYLAHYLEIHVHQHNRLIEKFIQSEPERIKYLLNEFEPERLFAREKIIIAGGRFLTSFPAAQVVRIDFISEPSSYLIFPPGIVDAVELTEAEYWGLIENPELGGEWSQKRGQDDSTVVFLEVEMAGQSPIFLALEIVLEPPDERPEAILRPLYPLTTMTLCFRMRNGGIAVLNLTHLVRFVLFPATQQAPKSAWPAYWANDPELANSARGLDGSADAAQHHPPFALNGRANPGSSKAAHNEDFSNVENY